MKKGLRIGTKISLTFLAVFVSVLLLVFAVIGSFFYAAVLEREVSRLEVMADSTADHIETYLGKSMMGLRLILGRIRLREFWDGYIESGKAEYLEGIQKMMETAEDAAADIERIMLADVSGRVMVSTDEDFIGKDISKEGFFTREETIHFFQENGEYKIFVSGPLLTSGGVTGVGVMVLKTGVLTDIITGIAGRGKTGEVLVVFRDSSGKINLPIKRRFEEEAIWRGQEGSIPVSTREALSGKIRVMFGVEDYRGRKVIAATGYARTANLALVAKVDEEEAYEEARKTILWLGAIFVLSVMLFFVVGNIVSRRITSSLAALRKGAEVIGAGDLKHRINITTNDEVGELSRAFDKMTMELQGTTTSREWFSAALESIAEGVVLTDVKGRIATINRVAREMIGWESAESTEGRIDDIFAIKERVTGKKLDNPVLAAIASGNTVKLSGDMVFAGMKGKTLAIECSASPIRNIRNQKMIGAILVFWDVTERNQRERRLRYLSAAVEQSPACVVITDTSGRIEYVNPKFSEITGYTREECLGKNPRILKSGAQSALVYKNLWDTISAGGEWRGEFYNKKKNGEFYWESASISAIRGIDGKVTHFVAVKEDITERKRFEAELQKAHDEVREILERAPFGVAILNSKKTILWMNEMALKMSGSSRLDAEGSDCGRFFKADGSCSCPSEGSGGEMVNFESALLRTDGEELPIIKNVREIEISGERVILETFADISELKKAQRAIGESEEKYRTLVENMPGIVYRCAKDADWTMYFISDEIQRLTGYPVTDFIMNRVRSFSSIIEEEDRESVNKEIGEAVAARRAYDVEYRLRCCDGNMVWVKDKGKCIFDDEGKAVWLDGVIVDLSLQKRAEAELEKAMDMQTEFTSTVSHELRTPLTTIKAGVSIVLDGIAGDINKEQKDFLETVTRNVDRLGRLINDVLDFQRLKSGKEKFVMEKGDINKLVESTYRDMLAEAEKRGLEFSLSLGEDVPQVVFDSDAITRVLVNLLSNAFKFTEKGGVTIFTKAKTEENVVMVSVEDTGAGIREEDLSRLFDEYVQLDKGKDRKTGGTGLGLAICKKLVSYHGGRIWAESEYGKWSRFSFVIPIQERRGSGRA